MEEELVGHYPARHWHKLEDGRIQCDVCPNACQLKDGKRGICFVRKREGEELILTTYGLASSLCIDPIEKKPLNQFLPGSSVLSFGTAGCNLSCKFCQNWQLSKAKELDALAKKILPAEIAQLALENGCASVAFTYNEPTIFLEYAVDVAKECHKLGIKTVAVTNGYICAEARKDFYAHIDAANVDLKAFTDEFYRKVTGTSLQPVLETLLYLKHQTEVWFEITTLLIPGYNDSKREIKKAASWIVENLGVDVPVHYSAFHPAWKMMDVPSTPLETLRRARDIALEQGIRYVYIGNVYDEQGSNTYCHKCKKSIIERSGFELLNYGLSEYGTCKFCGEKCAGVFAKKAGDWPGTRKAM